MRRVNSSLWSCRFVQHPLEFPLDGPFVLLTDSAIDDGAAPLLEALAGERFAGKVSSCSETPEGHRLVISSRDWPSLADAALSSLIPDRIVVLLHLSPDPHGYWDFALGGNCGPGLGPSLPRLIHGGGTDAKTFADAARHADYWMASRTERGRMSAGAHHLMCHYPDVTARHAGRLVDILSRLSDQKSREVLTRILFAGPEQVLESYSRIVFGPQQYMEIINIRPGDIIINGGVETGWELPYFVSAMRGEGHIHSFDPIFQIAGHWAEPTWRIFADMMSDHQIALTDNDRPLRLAIEPGFGTAYGSGNPERVIERGQSFMDCEGRALDSLVDEGRIGPFTVVKLDVEGGELAALRGMAHSLQRFRPRLAVAIYHEPDHFFDIPAYLMDLLDDYRFYIRHYSCGRFETLLYAVPAEDTDSVSGEECGPSAKWQGPTGHRPALVTVYRQDPTPRQTHRGEVRQLDRLSGGVWALSSIRAAARIDGLDILAVTEGKSPGLGSIVAKTPGGSGQDAVFVGEVTAPLTVAWRASRNVAAGSAVPVVGLAPETAIIAEYLAAEDALFVYRLAADATEGVTTIRSLGMVPLAVHPGTSEDSVRIIGREGESYRVIETTLAPTTAWRQQIGSVAAATGDFRAVCLWSNPMAGVAPSYGYLFTRNGQANGDLFTASAEEGFRWLRQLDWPCGGLVSTGRR